jgi:hypothetical protein
MIWGAHAPRDRELHMTDKDRRENDLKLTLGVPKIRTPQLGQPS